MERLRELHYQFECLALSNDSERMSAVGAELVRLCTEERALYVPPLYERIQMTDDDPLYSHNISPMVVYCSTIIDRVCSLIDCAMPLQCPKPKNLSNTLKVQRLLKFSGADIGRRRRSLLGALVFISVALSTMIVLIILMP